MASYVDIDDILMEEEPVSVIFQSDAAGVGILDPSSENNDVEARSKVELPFWLAQELFHQNGVVINLPNFYNQRVKNEVKADPGCIDLKSRCPYFYELGYKLAPLVGDPTLGAFLFTTLQGRYKDLLSKSHSAGLKRTPKFAERLTREEAQIFEAGRDSMTAFRNWRIEGTRLEKAAILGKKRRPSSDKYRGAFLRYLLLKTKLSSPSAPSSSNKLKALRHADRPARADEQQLKVELDRLEKQRGTLDPDAAARVIRLCEDAKSAEYLRRVHQRLLSDGSIRSIYLGNLLIRAYGQCKSPREAQAVFDAVVHRNDISWGCLITAYAQNRQCEEALQIYESMDSKPNAVIFATAIGACSSLKDVQRGKAIHARMLAIKGLKWDVVLENALLSMYARCRSLDEAFAVFQGMKSKTAVSWNAMIAAYAQNGHYQEALDLFKTMCKESQPNDITFTTVLVACAELGAIEDGREVHARLRAQRSQADVTVLNALVTMYGKCGCVAEALEVFGSIHRKDASSWSAVLGALAEVGESSREAIRLYWEMLLEGEPVNIFSLANILRACLCGGRLKAGMNIHWHIVQAGYESNVALGTMLVALYANNGMLEQARLAFEAIRGRDPSCWAVFIVAHARMELRTEVIELYKRMNLENVAPTGLIYATVLAACSSLNAFSEGKALHAESMAASRARGLELEGNALFGASLVQMYSKCGSLEDARFVFEGLECKDVYVWTNLIMGYARHGSPEMALELYTRMVFEGTDPNDVTMTAVLHACNHGGLHVKARDFFVSMVDDHGLEAELEHYGVMVDLLARLGRLDDAEELIMCMPFEPNKLFWSSLLGACRLHKDVRRATRVTAMVSKLCPQDPSAMVQLSNVHASNGDFIQMANVRKAMLQRGLRKRPGCSSIEVDSKMYEFAVGGDVSYPRYEEMLDELRDLSERIKEAGYVPDMSEVLHDVGDDEKELLLCLHSEKLAMSFGLISTPPGTTLRIFNTLRICSDCHAAAKFISKVVCREIIIRDANRFHTFVDGHCSCDDFW